MNQISAATCQEDVLDTSSFDKTSLSNIVELQRQCPDCKLYIDYKEQNILPRNLSQAYKIDATSTNFILLHDVLYRVSMKKGNKLIMTYLK